MSVPRHLSRRNFLATTAATTAATSAAVQWTAKSYGQIIGANERIRIGFIGAGGMGTMHLDAIRDLKEKDNLEAVAVADCWTTRAK